MANKRLSEGVGKKIVEALKKQSEIEVNPTSSSSMIQEESSFLQENLDLFSTQNDFAEETSMVEDDFLSSLSDESSFETVANESVSNQTNLDQLFPSAPQVAKPIPDNFVSELDNFEVPSNIAVLKKLITQLPSGVTRHTGAQIIRQTMEALGISMKSVLQEAQQLQDSLSSSAKECQNTIQEYKKHIVSLEKQSQNHQRQYSALNELISLFIQTK